MNLVRILGYFLSEALVSLWRSWKVSALAILTIAMSIFIGGTFLLLSGNLSRVVESWRQEAKVIIYLRDSAAATDLERIRRLGSQPAWVDAVNEISGSEASQRFRETFPSVQDLLDSWDEEPLPSSLEIAYQPSQADTQAFGAWLETLRTDRSVIMVDEDRDWLRQLDAFIGILRGVGAAVGLALLGAAVVTIGSVIRLTAYLYRDEISVMRLVGATELYIRGPFFFEGLIQGFLGGLIAVLTLYLAFLGLNPKGSTILLGTVLVDRFLPLPIIVALLGAATVAGCIGAILSLRREDLAGG